MSHSTPTVRKGQRSGLFHPFARRNLRREYITEDELISQLRLKGVRDLGEVRRAYMEADGNISVLRKKGCADA